MMRSGKANRLWNWTKGQIGTAVAPQNKRGEHSQQSCDTCEHLRGLDQSTRLAPASPANDQDRQRPSGLIDKRPTRWTRAAERGLIGEKRALMYIQSTGYSSGPASTTCHIEPWKRRDNAVVHPGHGVTLHLRLFVLATAPVDSKHLS
ncbi:hypothetical protein MHUMG1_00946 [Metarhizium humberi]|uniref:Uncharacterized protein n=1 Tax=Metarhizium humberi TaxID=2596975 RepID=A0A9P8MLQ0_9HYPO|nr:hypothetical protein MHUMG1_00946 [Metarhizium humberi]